MIRWSLHNYCRDPGVTVTMVTGSVDPNFPKEWVVRPEQPFQPSRMTNRNTVTWRIDLGASQPLDVVGLIHTNAVSPITGGSSAVHGGVSNSPTWPAGALPIAFDTSKTNPYNGRRSTWAGFDLDFYRYIHVVIDSTAAATTPEPYWFLGGVWAGTRRDAGRDIGWNFKATIVQPRIDVKPDHEGWTQRLIAGEPFTRLEMHRLALRDGIDADADQLRQWLDEEMAWEQADAALVMLREDYPPMTWVMRRLSQPEWTVAQDFPESDWTLEEILRG